MSHSFGRAAYSQMSWPRPYKTTGTKNFVRAKINQTCRASGTSK